MQNRIKKNLKLVNLAFFLLLCIGFLGILTPLNTKIFHQSTANISGTLQSTMSHTLSQEIIYGAGNYQSETGYDVAISNDGFIYVVGEDGSSNGLLVKYYPNGTEVWHQSWGGGFPDHFRAVTIDDAGNIYCLANTYVSNDDVGVVKYFPNGTKDWDVIWNGGAGEQGYDLAINNSAHDIFCVVKQNSGDSDIYVLKVNSSGDVEWAKPWNCPGNANSYAITLDTAGNIYCVGSTDYNSVGFEDLLLFKMSPDGTIIWNATWGTTDTDEGYGVLVDSSGAIYCSGDFYSDDTSSWDIVLVKFDAGGNQLWNQTFDHNGGDQYANGLARDSFGFFYCSGYEYADSEDFILVQFYPNGTVAGSFEYDYMGEEDEEYGLAISTDLSIYVCGYGYDLNYDIDLVLLKYQPAVPATPNVDAIIPSVDADGTVTITWNPIYYCSTYYICRSTTKIFSTMGLSTIGAVPVTNFTDHLPSNGIYYYTIIAGNVGVNSSISNCVNVTIAVPLNTPIIQSITPNPNRYGTVFLNWTMIPEAKFYYVFRSTSTITDVTGMSPIAIRSDCDFTDHISSDGSYYYAVVAGDGFANSSISMNENVVVKISAGTGGSSMDPLLLALIFPLIGACVALFILYRRKGV